MSDKISALPAAGTLTDADVLAIVNGAATCKVAVSTLRDRILVNATFLSFSGTPATAGAIRLATGTGINARDAGNTADVAVIYTTGGKTHVGGETAVDIEAVSGTLSAEFDASAVAGNTRLLLWDVTAGAAVRVTRGAADSGGAGFRLLRIPN